MFLNAIQFSFSEVDPVILQFNYGFLVPYFIFYHFHCLSVYILF
jgi:hypothetical protein